jgi:ABC-2 type transport system ATP-binding protein
MDEAERLCDRVVLLDAGRLVAQGTPAEVVAQTGLVPRAHVVTTRPLPAGWLDDVPGARLLEAAGTSATVALRGAAAVPAVLAAVARGGAEVVELNLHRPNLADAFFALTGRALRDDAGAAEPSA